MSNEVSPAAAKRIIEAIRHKLWEYNLEGNKEAKTMATLLAANVKRIVLEDINGKDEVNS